jgi:hypothetical protein
MPLFFHAVFSHVHLACFHFMNGRDYWLVDAEGTSVYPNNSDNLSTNSNLFYDSGLSKGNEVLCSVLTPEA